MTRPDLAEAARYELRTREVHCPQQVAAGTRDADDAGRSIAAWRAIVGLLDHGATEFEPVLCPTKVGEDGSARQEITPAAAWPALVAAAQAALEHRVGKGDSGRARALHAIRSTLIRSAIRQGAELPNFDNPAAATVGDREHAPCPTRSARSDGRRQQEAQAA